MCNALIDMGHAQPPSPAVIENATETDYSITISAQMRSRSIDMCFYWVRDRVRQGQFMVYWMAREYNPADYFTMHHPTSHHSSHRRIYIVPTADASNYACHMLHIYLQGFVESLPIRGNGLQTDKVSLLCEKERDDGLTEKNRPYRHPWYWRRYYRPICI